MEPNGREHQHEEITNGKISIREEDGFFNFVSFPEQMQSNGLLQRQLTGKNANYGSVEEPNPAIVTTTNPFISGTNPFRSEQIQPEAQDTYMHGTVEDRAY